MKNRIEFFALSFRCLLLTGCAGISIFVGMGSSWASANGFLNIVLDLDDTLIYEYEIREGKEFYHLAPGATEFLAALSAQIPNLNLYFFSAGTEERNLSVVAGLIEGAEKLLGKSIEYKVFSRHHMVSFKKDLSILQPDIDLGRTLLIDDNPDIVAPGQERNFLRVEGGLSRLDSPRWFQSELNNDPRSLDLFPLLVEKAETRDFLRKSLVEVLGAIVCAQYFEAKDQENAEMGQDSLGGMFLDFMERISVKDFDFFEIGLDAIRTQFPDFEVHLEVL